MGNSPHLLHLCGLFHVSFTELFEGSLRQQDEKSVTGKLAKMLTSVDMLPGVDWPWDCAFIPVKLCYAVSSLLLG